MALQPPRWSSNRGEGASGPSGAPHSEAEEISLQIELQGSSRTKGSKVQSLLLRAPWAWEMLHPAGGAVSSTATPRRSTTPSTRPCTPYGDRGTPSPLLDHRQVFGAQSQSPEPNGPSGEVSSALDGFMQPIAMPCKAVGDNGHALYLDCRERAPEVIVLRRIRPTGGFDGNSRADGGNFSHSRPEHQLALPALGPAALEPSANEAEVGVAARVPSAWLAQVESQCVRLEKIFFPKLSSHSEERLRRLGEELGEDNSLMASLADGIDRSGPDRLDGYLRDLRSVVRLVGPGLPGAARLLEGAVKGAVMALDGELDIAKQEIARLQARLDELSDKHTHAVDMALELEIVKKKNSELQKRLVTNEQREQDQARDFRKMRDALKEEINRLSPTAGTSQNVVGLMDTCSNLLDDLEDEGKRQTTILRDLSMYTASIVRESLNEDPKKMVCHKPGRVVELPNGELLLRPCDVAERDTQVTEADLLQVDPEAPIRLRMTGVRQLLAAFQGKDFRKMKIEDLQNEIEKIYTAKIIADSEADSAGLPRNELTDFVVGYYLEQTGHVFQAQERLISILDCIRRADRETLPPLKVALFSRFLEFCPCDQALPLSVLNIVLQAKRLANSAMLRIKADPDLGALPKNGGPSSKRARESNAPSDSFAARDPAEPTVALVVAWDSATKALPCSGCKEARKELFASLVRYAELFGGGADLMRPGMKDFYVLLLIIQDRLKREAATRMRDLVQKVESKGSATVDEFRDALREALINVDDSIWQPKLLPQGFVPQPGPVSLSDGLLLDYLGGGSINRMPRGNVTESQFIAATAEAVMAEVKESSEGMRKLWLRQTRGSGDPKCTTLAYEDFKTVLQSVDPSLPAATCKIVFLGCVEVSRSCFQYEGDACPVVGSMEASPSGLFGGEIVTLQHLQLEVLRNMLFVNQASEAEEPGPVAKSAGPVRSATMTSQRPPSRSPSEGPNVKKAAGRSR
ncbi:unnamed protein product [Polarella glacialis]|uniref:Uncharacterized protein n=1 Tax=Polarella glacialis TaxID=89957 RepID=A0A813FTT9_POLGL|nr:unnamed protein product [Polarella glacialis]